MKFLMVLVSLLGVILLIRTFNRYGPNLDLVQSGRKYILFLWYNKYDWSDKYEGRRYIKLFEI